MMPQPYDTNKNQIVPIFSGGGTRLTCHIGILQALLEMKLTFSHVVGISGGSIVCALYCSGMPLEKILTLALHTDFKQFKGYSIFRLLKEGGLSSGNQFENWMDKQLNGKTFSQLSTDLSIVATDVNGGGPVIFNKETSPDLKVSQAVRFSMSIPLIFSFKTYGDHLLVDGAILAEDALFRNWTDSDAKNVCFRLKSQQIHQVRKRQAFFHLPEYIFMLIKTFMTALSREYVHAEHWHNTIIVETGTYSSVDFSLTVEQKKELYQIGYDTAHEFLPKKITPIQ
ncbi:patatin-like phospholipase family protein [Aliiglaciecola sp. 2_MG-2023]|uniref:patatin-like phospholipase family protein n=1 Tax=unclassified Aliiglaciecola TaxID=2593648 RepID=UPI0026E26965|nr:MULTISPECIES: patatin-like phospholipase family protein [unclassified Aliiglaciecola]MDO6709991.1 patatin-like phospholipase family protein [Aliiglaciecola sp. 2_MG-2023]MDO6751139.1 patatin-like phospholipase family protein [Aliiglaciecola sp. 1_MG-2023]